MCVYTYIYMIYFSNKYTQSNCNTDNFTLHMISIKSAQKMLLEFIFPKIKNSSKEGDTFK